MVVVAQLVRAPDCGSGSRRFETDLPPQKKKLLLREAFSFGVEDRSRTDDLLNHNQAL